MRRAALTLAILLVCTQRLTGQAWSPDAGAGRYRNPIIYADYSDPDVIRVGDDFYMTASSFESVPALPILHSRDLVHWRIVNHAVRRLDAAFDVPQHGNGVWAPSIRFHDGWYYIYYGDPDRGIYMVRTREVLSAWEPPVLVRAAKGWIDPSPLWDDDGNAYLVHAFANSRAGIKSVLHVNRMSPDGTRLLDDGVLVFDGHEHHPTIEGPKFYKRDGWYYIFAPAGGVPTGWQTVLRSRNPLGPYEDRIVMTQGKSDVNGPHQGGWVSLANGENWFIHFQDRGAAGRIAHLQPMTWSSDGWPVIGTDDDGDGVGEPVSSHAMPGVSRRGEVSVPQTSDDFSAGTLALQWQWQANDKPEWMSLSTRPGWLRLFTMAETTDANLWLQPNVLLQKFPAPAFTATTRVSLSATGDQSAGLVILGSDYASIALRRSGEQVSIVRSTVMDAPAGKPAVSTSVPVSQSTLLLRARCVDNSCQLAYSVDDKTWTPLGDPFTPKAGRWVGAKIGLFTSGTAGYADFDLLRIAPP